MLSGNTSFRTKQRDLMEKSCKISRINQVNYDPRVGTYIDSESSNADAPSLGSLARAHFAGSVFSLPPKTKEHPHGVYTEQEIYKALAVIFTYILSEIDPAKSVPLRLAAKALISANREAKFFPKQGTVRIARSITDLGLMPVLAGRRVEFL